MCNFSDLHLMSKLDIRRNTRQTAIAPYGPDQTVVKLDNPLSLIADDVVTGFKLELAKI